MEKFIPHVNEYARSVIDLVTIYVSLKIPLKSGSISRTWQITSFGTYQNKILSI